MVASRAAAGLAHADFSMIRRPGNFSYIYAWLSTVSIGRQLTPNVRLMGEVLFDRHGSRAFEGFHLSREGARVNVIWSPPRRPSIEPESDTGLRSMKRMKLHIAALLGLISDGRSEPLHSKSIRASG